MIRRSPLHRRLTPVAIGLALVIALAGAPATATGAARPVHASTAVAAGLGTATWPLQPALGPDPGQAVQEPPAPGEPAPEPVQLTDPNDPFHGMPPLALPDPPPPLTGPAPADAADEAAPQDSGAPVPTGKKLSKSEQKKAEKLAVESLPQHYQEWLEEVDVLITKAERSAFLTLAKDYQRDAFIDRFWAVRDPYPDTARNEMRDNWSERVLVAKQEFGSLKEDRARLLLLNGYPAVRFRPRCTTVLWPLEIWVFPKSQRLRDPLIVVFVQRYGLGRYTIWQPAEGLASLAQHTPFGGSNNQILNQIANECPTNDQLLGALSALLRQGSMAYTMELARAEEKIAGPSREWASTFNAYSTDLPADAQPLAGELSIAFPGRRQSRTIAQGALSVAAGDVGRANLGGHESYNFVLNGEVLLGRKLFDAFRYKFDFPAGSVGEKIPLLFERFLRPGNYTLIVKLEDLNSGRFYRSERPLEVPALDATPLPPPDPETAALLAESNAAIVTGDSTVKIVRPRGEMQVGMVRFDALTTGPEIAEVSFLLDGRPLLKKTRPPFSVELDLGSVPRTRLLRAEAFDAGGELVASDEMGINASSHRFDVHLVEPRAGRQYGQSLRAVARVEVPEADALERVEFYLDETRLATLYQEPWEQPIVLPPGSPIAYVRVVAYLTDGNSTEDLVFVNSPDYLEQVDVQLVELFIAAVDRAGKPVQDLALGDFAVTEDGVAQEPVRFEKVENLPIHAAVLLDTSASMEENMSEAQQAALAFFQSTIKPRDRAAVIPFNDRPTLSVKFTNRMEELAGGLAGLKAERGTALWDSIVFSLFYFNGVKGQRALLVLSDGKDENSRFPFDTAREFARRAGVAIYSVGLGIKRMDLDTRHKLEKLSEETGGTSWFIKEIAELPAIYAAIEQELRSRYLLAYQSTNTSRENKFRTIEVKVARPGVEARTLRGYYP